MSKADLISQRGHVVYGHRNLFTNGAMQVAQRGVSSTGITTSGIYTVDRTLFSLANFGTWTQTQESDGPEGFSKSFKVECTTPNASLTSGSFGLLGYKFEGQDLQNLKKGTSSAESVTLSFWVKSNKTGTYVSELLDFDNSNRHIGKTFTVNSSDTWEYKTITYEGDTTGVLDDDNGASLQLSIWLGGGSDFSSGTLQTSWGANSNTDRAAGNVNLADNPPSGNYYFQITGLQLEIGNTATPFDHRPFSEYLNSCLRYYQKSYNYDVEPGTSTINGMSKSPMSSTNLAIFTERLFPHMVDEPTVTIYDQAGNSGRVRVQATDNVQVNGTGNVEGTEITRSAFQLNTGLDTSGDHFRFHFVAETNF